MDAFRDIIRLAAVSTGAILLGRWFLTEMLAAHARREPWYAPYLTPPGILVLLVILLPFLLWLFRS